jgi:hypothetical protein
VAIVSNNKTFVNQAVYDAAKGRLLVTVNGGQATTEPTAISVAGLDLNKYHAVTRDGVAYKGAAWQGDKFVITTPPLSATEESYVIEEGTAPVPAPTDEGCRVGGAAMETPALALLFLLVLAGRLTVGRTGRSGPCPPP